MNLLASQLIVGAGKFGKRFYHYLLSLNNSPITLSRSEKHWSENHIQADLLGNTLQLPRIPKLDNVYILLAPNERSEDAYQKTYIDAVTNLLQQLKQQQSSFNCTFLSATSVYGSNQMDVIDEGIAAEPDNFRGKILLEAERNILQQHGQVSIVRASGLYSKERKRLINSLLDPNEVNNPKWMNLIHEDDLCRWLYKASVEQWPISIASDGCPFTRKAIQLSQETMVNTTYRQFKSDYLQSLELKHPSFVDWLTGH